MSDSSLSSCPTGNLCINSLDVGIQFTAGVVVTNNIVYNSKYSGIGCIGNQVLDCMGVWTWRYTLIF